MMTQSRYDFGGTLLLQSLLTGYYGSLPPDVTIFFSFFSVPGLSSDGRLAQPEDIDEVGSLQQVLFRASERFCKCGSLGPSAMLRFLAEAWGQALEHTQRLVGLPHTGRQSTACDRRRRYRWTRSPHAPKLSQFCLRYREANEAANTPLPPPPSPPPRPPIQIQKPMRME